jgi:hypothetical protein
MLYLTTLSEKQEVRRYGTWTKFRIYPKDENAM